MFFTLLLVFVVIAILGLNQANGFSEVQSTHGQQLSSKTSPVWVNHTGPNYLVSTILGTDLGGNIGDPLSMLAPSSIAFDQTGQYLYIAEDVPNVAASLQGGLFLIAQPSQSRVLYPVKDGNSLLNNHYLFYFEYILISPPYFLFCIVTSTITTRMSLLVPYQNGVISTDINNVLLYQFTPVDGAVSVTTLWSITIQAGQSGSLSSIDGIGTFAQFASIIDMIITKNSDYLYVIDSPLDDYSNPYYILRKVSSKDWMVTTIPVILPPLPNTNIPNSASGSFLFIRLAIDYTDTNLYISNQLMVYKMSLTTSSGYPITLIAGNLSSTAIIDGPITHATFLNIGGIAIDFEDNLYVTDSWPNYIGGSTLNVVRLISRKTNMITTIAGHPCDGHFYQGTSFAYQPTGCMQNGNGMSSSFFFIPSGNTNNPPAMPYLLVSPNGTDIILSDLVNNQIRQIVCNTGYEMIYGICVLPTATPTSQPSVIPSAQPVHKPSSHPSRQPSSQPSKQPIPNPTTRPSHRPSSRPSKHPTKQPIARPSSHPSKQPTANPSAHPSHKPSKQPVTHPTSKPTCLPLVRPTSHPTTQPTSRPSRKPSSKPSLQPRGKPTRQPITHPTSQPSRVPIEIPTSQPTIIPFSHPTRRPIPTPTSKPSHVREPTQANTCNSLIVETVFPKLTSLDKSEDDSTGTGTGSTGKASTPKSVITASTGKSMSAKSAQGKSSANAMMEYLLDSPTGVAVDASNTFLYVADPTANQVIRLSLAFTEIPGTPNDEIKTLLDAHGSFTWVAPTGIAVDTLGNVYVTDQHRVSMIPYDTQQTEKVIILVGGVDGPGQIYSNPSKRSLQASVSGKLDGSVVSNTGKTAGLGSGQSSGSAAAAVEASLSYPIGIATDTMGRCLYVADSGNNAIRRITLTKNNTTSSVAVIDTVVASPYLNTPYGIALDYIDNGGHVLYVTSFNGHAVFRIPVPMLEDTIDPLIPIFDLKDYLFAGPSSPVSGLIDGSVTNARFTNPSGIAIIGPSRYLYISDRPVVEASSSEAEAAGKSSVVVPNTAIMVVESITVHAIRKITISTMEVTTIAGGHFGCVASSTSSTSSTSNSAKSIATSYSSAAATKSVKTAVSNTGSAKLNSMDRSITTSSSRSGKASSSSSSSNSASGSGDGAITGMKCLRDGFALFAKFLRPAGLAIQATQDVLYVADSGNGVIRNISCSTCKISSLCFPLYLLIYFILSDYLYFMLFI